MAITMKPSSKPTSRARKVVPKKPKPGTRASAPVPMTQARLMAIYEGMEEGYATSRFGTVAVKRESVTAEEADAAPSEPLETASGVNRA